MPAPPGPELVRSLTLLGIVLYTIGIKRVARLFRAGAAPPIAASRTIPMSHRTIL
jgi:hypothetical protein